MAARFTECPHCGATFRVGKLACPDCGSDASTGWRSAEDIDYESVELPDVDPPPRPRSTIASRVAIAALAAILLGLALLRLF